MPSEAGTAPAVLGFDTSGGWCCAAVVSQGRVLTHRHDVLPRGQGERLMPFLEGVLAEAGLDWRGLSAIGVGVGPGNFTGIRISVAAARGLALGLGIPAIGINRFEALSLDGAALPVLVPAVRGQGWLQTPGHEPVLIDAADAAAPIIADPLEFPALAVTPPAVALAIAIARLAEARRDTPQPRPAPMYLRAADAAPPSEAPPALIE